VRSILGGIAAAAALVCAARADDPEPATLTDGDGAALAQSINDLRLSGNRHIPARLVGGGCGGRGPSWGAAPIALKTGAVRCTMSDVAVGSMSCDVSPAGGPAKKTVIGLQAYAFIAALRAAGIEGEGAAGSTHFAAQAVICTIDQKALAECGGGGVTCILTR
jgi:hypothetical protein